MSKPDPQKTDKKAADGLLTKGQAWLLAGAIAVLVLSVSFRIWRANNADTADEPIAENAPPKQLPGPEPRPFHGHEPKGKPAEKEQPDDFLSEFNRKDPEPDKETGQGTLTNAELEKNFQALAETNGQMEELQRHASLPGTSDEDAERALKEYKRLVGEYDRQSAALDKATGQARKARPSDPVPRWLTGELLMLVKGAPEEIYPHLQFAAEHGLKRAHLAGSFARVQLEFNQFDESYRTAAVALDKDPRDRYLWDAFARAAISGNQFDAVLDRLNRDFPTGPPAWAKRHQQEAEALQVRWTAEQKLRAAEKRADDLPRVRLVIEHRRFARDPNGQPLTTIESTGRGEVILELFENEAPITVANFIDLVTRKFYDGTAFHLALPATMAVGGDPNTKATEPKDVGKGGPGYVIPDESRAPNARSHFRGSISMVKIKPDRASAGSQFLFGLTPLPGMDGNFTVFGRVLQGQDVVDRITRGRTTRAEDFNRIIPGDLLVRAEVVRKRSHEYRAIKEAP